MLTRAEIAEIRKAASKELWRSSCKNTVALCDTIDKLVEMLREYATREVTCTTCRDCLPCRAAALLREMGEIEE